MCKDMQQHYRADDCYFHFLAPDAMKQMQTEKYGGLPDLKYCCPTVYINTSTNFVNKFIPLINLYFNVSLKAMAPVINPHLVLNPPLYVGK